MGRARHGWLAVILVAGTAASAGCLQTSDDLELAFGKDGLAAGGERIVRDISGSDCVATAAMFLVPFSVSDHWLPPGYRPRDLGSVMPGYSIVAGGKVPLLASTVSCQASVFGTPYDYGAISFLVHGPVVSGVEEPAGMDLYVVRHLSDDAGLKGVFEQMGVSWKPIDSTASVTALAEPDLAESPLRTVQGGLQAISGSGLEYRFEMVAGVAQNLDDDTVIRYWHDTGEGTTYHEGTLPANGVLTGVLLSCQVQSGSLLAEMIGEVQCPDPGSGGEETPVDQQAVLLPHHDMPLEAVYLPGVHAL